MRVSKREGVTLGANITEETVSGYYDVYATDRPTTRYYHDGQSGYEEDYTRKVSGTDTVDVVRYGLGPRGIESQRVWSGSVGSALSQTALGFPVYDTHGNNVGMVSLSGSVAHERTYSPWGEVLSSNGSPPQQGYCANLGHRQDAESSLTYMRARYYEPSTCRFISQDPARDGTNWYAYCGNDPVNYSDGNGEFRLVIGDYTFYLDIDHGGGGDLHVKFRGREVVSRWASGAVKHTKVTGQITKDMVLALIGVARSGNGNARRLLGLLGAGLFGADAEMVRKACERGGIVFVAISSLDAYFQYDPLDFIDTMQIIAYNGSL